MSDEWMARRVLVTGATGLVGSRLVSALLERGAEVAAVILDRDQQSEFYRTGLDHGTTTYDGPLEDPAVSARALSLFQPDTVFHLAAQTQVGAAHRAPFATFESNVRATYTLMESCRTILPGVDAIIVASSDKAYGAQPQLPYVESMPLDAVYPYDASKACTEIIAQSYGTTFGLPVSVARCGNIYGPGDLNWDRIVPGTIRSVEENRRPVVRSDGTPSRDYIHVDDVVAAYMRLAERIDTPGVAGGAFNFSLDHPVSVLDMIAAIQESMGSDLEPEILAISEAEIQDQFLSSEKARSLLGWSPQYDLVNGLAHTIPWYLDLLRNSPTS